MSDPTPAPGWYPAPHANNEQRYWDGAQWLEPTADAAPTATARLADPINTPTPATKKGGLGIAALVTGIVAFLTGLVPVLGIVLGLIAVALGILVLVRKQSKGFGIAAITLGAIAAILSLVMTISFSTFAANLPTSSAPTTTTTVEKDEEPAEEDAPVAMVTVPDVAGMTAGVAFDTLKAAGLNPPPLSTIDDSAVVISTTPAAGSEVEEESDITFTLEEKPKLTLGQQNAISKAQDYLDYSGFSRTGLIQQLEFEGYTTEDATFGADNAGADWNAECAEKAKDYLAYSSFSREGLADQLAFEGFLPAEIEFGLAAVGY